MRRKEVLQQQRDLASLCLPAVFAQLVGRTRTAFCHAVCDLRVPQLVFGRTMLLGDAGFIVAPHMSGGGCWAAVPVGAARVSPDVFSEVQRLHLGSRCRVWRTNAGVTWLMQQQTGRVAYWPNGDVIQCLDVTCALVHAQVP